jgi:Ribonuclease G/E
VLRDLVGENTQSIRIDSREQFALLKSFGQEYMPAGAQAGAVQGRAADFRPVQHRRGNRAALGGVWI